MNTKGKCSTGISVLSLFLLIVMFSPPLTAQQEAEPAAPAQEMAPATFQGELWSVDANAKTLVVKNSAGTEMKFSYSDETEIVGAAEAKGVEGLATMKGMQVRVHYQKEAETNKAVRIEVLSSGQSAMAPAAREPSPAEEETLQREEPQAAAEEAGEELPETASPLPLLMSIGAASLGAGGLVGVIARRAS